MSVSRDSAHIVISEYVLAVFQVPLDDPSKLQERIRSLVVPQVDTLSCVTNDITRTGVSRRPIPHKLLEIRNVVRRY